MSLLGHKNEVRCLASGAWTNRAFSALLSFNWLRHDRQTDWETGVACTVDAMKSVGVRLSYILMRIRA